MSKERFFIGLYSGWSADGVDAAMVSCTGKSEKLKATQLHQSHHGFSEDLRRRILDISCDKAVPVQALIQLQQDVSMAFAEAAQTLIRQSSIKAQDITAVGCSNQIACRTPRDPKDKTSPSPVLEIGMPAVIAAKVKLPVVAGFVQNDIALGGQGGPIWAWGDWVLFHDRRLSRAIVDLGGIVSLSLVGSDAHPLEVVAFDVGPGTVLLDAVSDEVYGRAVDIDGSLASRGKVAPSLLNELLANPYFQRPAPKLTDRQQWGPMYISRLKMVADRHRCAEEDLLTTVAEMVAKTISNAVNTLTERPHEIVLSGGGARNIYLASRIRALLSPSSTINSEKFGIGVRVKQAVCMAILAAARVDKTPVYCPFATGAKWSSVLGSLTEGPEQPLK